MSEDIRKKEDAELREYQKKSFVRRAVTATAAMVLSGLAAYLRGKAKRL